MKLIAITFSILCLIEVLRAKNEERTVQNIKSPRQVGFAATSAEQSIEIKNSYSKLQTSVTTNNSNKQVSYGQISDSSCTINSKDTISDDQDKDQLVDPASRTLQSFKDRHQTPFGMLTTSAGRPIDIRFTNSCAESNLISNGYFIESIKHLTNEKIPQRVVNAKGIGAHGYFEVTHDVTKYTKANLFENIGKITPVFARLGPGAIERGQSDTLPIAFRGLSFKFYTEEGNLDFLSIQVPVFILRDPVLFPEAVHALNYLSERTGLLDYVTLRHEALHWFLWTASEYGLPRGLRHMNGYPIHTYELYNKNGESFFVRFKFLSELGFEGLSLNEAKNISSIDPDFFIRDVYNSIEYKKFPAWRLEMDLLTDKQRREANFNPFDMTSLWPNGTYQTIPIGRIVLNRNVDNHFRYTEQSAFYPANLVPGIKSPSDPVFKGRRIAYFDTQVNRLGINYNNIEVNRPNFAATYDRDGSAPVRDNMKDAPSYFPNTFNGPEALKDEAYPARRIIPIEYEPVDFLQARSFYQNILRTDCQKQRLIDILVNQSIRVVHYIQQRFTELLMKVDNDLARKYSEALAAAKKTTFLPAVFDDFNREKQ